MDLIDICEHKNSYPVRIQLQNRAAVFGGNVLVSSPIAANEYMILRLRCWG
jgi:hypothetical protein